MSTVARRGARAAAGGLPAVGTPVMVWIGPYRQAGMVVDHRIGKAWVELITNGTEEPRHILLSADELEYPDSPRAT